MESIDPRIMAIHRVQREVMALNCATTMIRGVLPRRSDIVIALEHEIIQRSKTIRYMRMGLVKVEAGGKQ